MSHVPLLVHSVDFVNVQSVIVAHGANATVDVQLIVDGQVRPSLIDRIAIDSVNPTNSMTVYLLSPQTGTIQVYRSPSVSASSPSPAESAVITETVVTQGAAPSDPLMPKSYIDSIAGSRSWLSPVLDKDLTVPPGAPATGDRYLIVGVGFGAWSGHDGEVAEYTGTVWAFTVPVDGSTVKVADEDSEYSQVNSSAPWSWTETGGSTSVHGNEKHSPSMITVGGNRSDANVDLLTSGGNADALHRHSKRDLTRLYFLDDFLGKKLNKHTWDEDKNGGGSSVRVYGKVGGQLRCRSGGGNKRSSILGWDEEYALDLADTTIRVRVRREDQVNSYTEVGLNLSSGQIRFDVSGAGTWFATTDDGVVTTTDTSVTSGDSWNVLEIRTTPTLVSFLIDGVLKATHTTNIPPGNMEPYVFQSTTGGGSARDTWVDYVEIDGVRS